MRIAVLHPDLGIGGAERLIIDICLSLSKSHDVKIFTGYHDKSRAFEETKDGQLSVNVVGNGIPRSIFGKFHAVIANIKMVIIALYVIFLSKFSYDIVICDQVASCLPIFRLLDFRNRPKLIFYCHFPDCLLVQKKSKLRTIYRYPLDYLEEVATSTADKIVVNSQFTASTVKKTFQSLKQEEFQVLYPCVDNEKFDRFKLDGQFDNLGSSLKSKLSSLQGQFVFFSLNRFERKKNLTLALEAFKKFLDEARGDDVSKGPKLKAHLIIAGGYDDRLKENVEYFAECDTLVEDSSLDERVTFVKNPSDTEKLMLLKCCDVVLYTPENEHFGIVPLEAMAMSKPVIGLKSGGVMETVVHNKTGLLVEPGNLDQFKSAMLYLYNNRDCCNELGIAGHKRVEECFSRKSFETDLEKICSS